MKRQLFTLIFAVAVSILLGAGSTFAQSSQGVRADIPFAFSANNKILPAGNYQIYPRTDDRSVWMIENRSEGVREFVLSRELAGRGNYDNLHLTFHRYGERNFLVAFETRAYEVGLPKSKQEKALGRDMLSKLETISVETTTQGSR